MGPRDLAGGPGCGPGGDAVIDHHGGPARQRLAATLRPATSDLLTRSYPRVHPDPFRTARDLGRVFPVVSGKSGEPGRVVYPRGSQRGCRPRTTPGDRPPWPLSRQPELSPVTVVAPDSCPGPSPEPAAAGPGDGRVLSGPSSRAHEPCNSTGVVALRSGTGLTGSGSHGYSYGGFGEDTHASTRIPAVGNPISALAAVSIRPRG